MTTTQYLFCMICGKKAEITSFGVLCYSCYYQKWRESEINEADIDFEDYTEFEITLPPFHMKEKTYAVGNGDKQNAN